MPVNFVPLIRCCAPIKSWNAKLTSVSWTRLSLHFSTSCEVIAPVSSMLKPVWGMSAKNSFVSSVSFWNCFIKRNETNVLRPIMFALTLKTVYKVYEEPLNEGPLIQNQQFNWSITFLPSQYIFPFGHYQHRGLFLYHLPPCESESEKWKKLLGLRL